MNCLHVSALASTILPYAFIPAPPIGGPDPALIPTPDPDPPSPALPTAHSCQVTIVPREKHPLGQTVVKANEDRELTGLFTRGYLEEQLLTVLAGRAGKLR